MQCGVPVKKSAEASIQISRTSPTEAATNTWDMMGLDILSTLKQRMDNTIKPDQAVTMNGNEVIDLSIEHQNLLMERRPSLQTCSTALHPLPPFPPLPMPRPPSEPVRQPCIHCLMRWVQNLASTQMSYISNGFARGQCQVRKRPPELNVEAKEDSEGHFKKENYRA